jgi:hypothetical protein
MKALGRFRDRIGIALPIYLIKGQRPDTRRLRRALGASLACSMACERCMRRE